MSYWHGNKFEPTKARPVDGGVKAHARRGAFANTWWAQRWLASLEDFLDAGRLGRGRTYARQGQVLGIEIGKGVATASVQGSRRRPYQVKIQLRTYPKHIWQQIAADLIADMRIGTKLLAGEMPEGIEAVFDRTGAPLFPVDGNDLETTCTCPDWSNPCKHIAAVFYLMAEEFDRDPFLLFQLRGVARADLVELLGGGKEAATDEQNIPLEPDPAVFWRGLSTPAAAAAATFDLNPDGDAEAGSGDAAAAAGNAANSTAGIARDPAAIVRQLGNFPFWRGSVPFLPTLEQIYARAAGR